MTAYTVTLADGRVATVDADEITVTAAGALVLLRGDPPPRSPVAVLAPRTWHSCFPAGASPLPPTPGTPPAPNRAPYDAEEAWNATTFEIGGHLMLRYA